MSPLLPLEGAPVWFGLASLHEVACFFFRRYNFGLLGVNFLRLFFFFLDIKSQFQRREKMFFRCMKLQVFIDESMSGSDRTSPPGGAAPPGVGYLEGGFNLQSPARNKVALEAAPAVRPGRVGGGD